VQIIASKPNSSKTTANFDFCAKQRLLGNILTELTLSWILLFQLPRLELRRLQVLFAGVRSTPCFHCLAS
jgi:hypothetical protein